MTTPSTAPRKHLPKPVGLTIVLVVLLALIAGMFVGGRKAYNAVVGTPDYKGAGSGSKVVQIHDGDSAGDIAATLKSSGVVKSTKAFIKAANANTRSRNLQAGFYKLRLKMAASQALTLLLSKGARVGKVTIPEGRPLADVVDRMVKGSTLKREDITEALANPTVLGLPSYAGGKAEGFLFPATYNIDPDQGAVDALTLMTAKFADEAAAVDLETGAKDLGLSPYDVVKIASIIEGETAVDADRPKVARAVLNRLKAGMRLQLDSTLNYVRGERKARLSIEDISEDSPYNTYKVTGLPPTPISSPGRKSLEAALHPATGDYIYFVTIDKAGNSLFTKSYDEFLAAKAKAKRESVY
jgi:UPF0755 protein